MRFPLLWIAGALLLPGCVQSSFNAATQKTDYTFTSVEKEVSIGRKLAKKVVEEIPPVSDPAVQQRVETIGQRIVAVCDRKELVYSFTALKEKEVNAFSLPGGYVFIYEGLINKAKTDDELAGVIAHEVGHIAARHSITRHDAALASTLAQLAAIATREVSAAQGLSVALQMTELAGAREDEQDADKLAVKYMKAAGYDPLGILTFMDTMEKVNDDKARYLPRGAVRPQYAQTHPYIPERKLTIKEALYGVADYIDYLNVPQ